MSGNVKFRWFLKVTIVVTLLAATFPVVSWAGEIEDAKEVLGKKIEALFEAEFGELKDLLKKFPCSRKNDF